jgi:hypothetical protein
MGTDEVSDSMIEIPGGGQREFVAGRRRFRIK